MGARALLGEALLPAYGIYVASQRSNTRLRDLADEVVRTGVLREPTGRP